MTRLLVISCSHVCETLYTEPKTWLFQLLWKLTRRLNKKLAHWIYPGYVIINPRDLPKALFFIDQPRSTIIDDPSNYLAQYCPKIPDEERERIFHDLLIPAILLAEKENRCRWSEQLTWTWEPGKHTNWQEHVETFLLEHGYPKLFDDPEIKRFLPFCSTGIHAVSHAIRILKIDLQLC